MSALAPPGKELKIDIGRPIRAGILLVTVGFFGFLLWAALAPITSAAVAPGVIVADSRNKDIQHLEGGIIRQVSVREGDRVSAGQSLVRLDSAAANANLARLEAARRSALALEARLVAERDGAERVAFPAELAATPEGADAVKGQELLFESNRTSRESERGILEQRIAQYREEIKGIEAQIHSENEQISLIAKEMAGSKELLDKGLERKSRYLALQRTAADLNGRRGGHVAQVARAKQSVAEVEERLVNLKAQRVSETVSELRDVQAKLADTTEQINAASDASRRLDVKAPVDGKVITIFRETPGSVVKPGETIMELLPDHDQLVIEAHVKPEDIESVAPGATARVRLTAYSQRRTSSLKGHLKDVSADRLVDAKTGRPYFLARVVVNAGELERQSELKLYPGMPATVFIESGRQTMLQYFLTPLFGGIDKAFRES
ncbi:MAG: HlyD family type I secretion periplasmic adaptor subunit [Alphaproteobacteria bacterium]